MSLIPGGRRKDPKYDSAFSDLPGLASCRSMNLEQIVNSLLQAAGAQPTVSDCQCVEGKIR